MAQNITQQPPAFMTGLLNTSQPFLPQMSFASIPQNNTNQNQPQYTPEQYAIAQQMAMQNMMQQMYLQYLNQYSNAMQQSNPGMYPNFAQPSNLSGAQQQDSSNLNTNTSSAQTQQQQQQQPPQAPNVQPEVAQRFQADDDVENRDWLEILYTLSRLIVLLSLVYFYSSPGRCSIVILVMVLYYL